MCRESQVIFLLNGIKESFAVFLAAFQESFGEIIVVLHHTLKGIQLLIVLGESPAEDGLYGAQFRTCKPARVCVSLHSIDTDQGLSHAGASLIDQ